MNWITELINSNAPTFSTLTFLLGLIAGNWLAIGRDRRKEFNDVATPNFIKLKGQIEAAEQGAFTPGIDDFKLLEIHIPWHKRKCFSQIAKKYKNAHQDVVPYDPETGIATVNPEKIKELKTHAKKLLPYLKRC